MGTLKSNFPVFLNHQNPKGFSPINSLRENNRILPSSGLLGDVRRFNTDVSGLPIGPIIKGQALFLLLGQLDP